MRIKELTVAQLGRHAQNVFLFAGRHQSCARLVYHALTKDPDEPRALRALSDILAGDLLEPSGWEQLSTAVLEHALRAESPLSQTERKSFDDHLFLAKWSWSFARKRNGEPTASAEELRDRSLFVLDEEGYRKFLAGIVDRCGSLTGTFRVAHTLAGALGRLLTHKTLGQSAPIEEVFFPERFEPSADYAAWLESDAAEFDALEAERQRRTAPQGSPMGTGKRPWWKFW